jgi:hypothetical protein
MSHSAWKVVLEETEHKVELDWGDAWGNLIVKVDGEVVERGTFIWHISSTRVNFWVADELATLRVSGIFSPKWNLYVKERLIKEEKGTS